MNEQEARELTGRRRELLAILPRLRRFALSLTRDGTAADDLLHATVARVLQRGLPIGAELVPWCIRVCRDLWQDQTRAGELRQTVGSDCFPFAGPNVAHAEDARTSDGREVQLALSELSDEQRAVLELVAVEGYSYRAAAAMLDMPMGRVMGRLARARGTLIEHCRPASPVSPAGKPANP